MIQKYRQKHENNAWYSYKGNSYKHLIFKDVFVEHTDVIGLQFRINKFCISRRGSVW